MTRSNFSSLDRDTQDQAILNAIEALNNLPELTLTATQSSYASAYEPSEPAKELTPTPANYEDLAPLMTALTQAGIEFSTQDHFDGTNTLRATVLVGTTQFIAVYSTRYGVTKVSGYGYRNTDDSCPQFNYPNCKGMLLSECLAMVTPTQVESVIEETQLEEAPTPEPMIVTEVPTAPESGDTSEPMTEPVTTTANEEAQSTIWWDQTSWDDAILAQEEAETNELVTTTSNEETSESESAIETHELSAATLKTLRFGALYGRKPVINPPTRYTWAHLTHDLSVLKFMVLVLTHTWVLTQPEWVQHGYSILKWTCNNLYWQVKAQMGDTVAQVILMRRIYYIKGSIITDLRTEYKYLVTLVQNKDSQLRYSLARVGL